MSRSILLADDSVNIRKVVSLVFEDEAYTVTALDSGEEALEALESERPDVVISDVHMPGTSGYEVARATKERSPEIPVLLLVGTFEPFDEEEFEACGADGHLLKPFAADELREWVESAAGAAPPVEPPSEPEAAAEAAETTVEEAPAAVGGSSGSESRGEADTTEASEASRGEDSPGGPSLSPDEVDRIARRVVELMSTDVVEELARQIVPETARALVERRLEQLEREAE